MYPTNVCNSTLPSTDVFQESRTREILLKPNHSLKLQNFGGGEGGVQLYEIFQVDNTISFSSLF